MSQQITIPGPGDLLAERYRIVEELGRGSYGVVFKAIEVSSDRVVAIKTLLPQSVLDKEVIDRFEREAQLVSRLQHLNIIGLHDYGQRDNLFYMVMEFIEGRSLDDLLKEDAPIAPDKARDLLVQIMEALEHAHEKGIVHRDLKPANILLQPTSSGREVVKILDFGIAKALRDEHQDMKTLTQAGHVLGTPHYMSPEQIAGDEVDHRSDLYALGVITYELLVGEHPFEGTSPTAVMVAHLRDDPPALPDHLERSKWGVLVRESMRKQPDDRIAGAPQFLSLLTGNHDLIDGDESNEVTALYSPSSFTEDDRDQGATQEMEPLTHLYSPAQLAAGAAKLGADATMQWQRKELPPEPDFGAQPLSSAATHGAPAAAPGFGPPTTPRDFGASPVAPPRADVASTLPGEHFEQKKKRSRTPVFVMICVCIVLTGAIAAYSFWIAPKDTTPTDASSLEPDAGVVPVAVTVEDMGAPIKAADMKSEQDAGLEEETTVDMPADQESAQPKPERVAAPDKDAPKKKPSHVSLKITSSPPEALVRVGGKEIGNTPLTHRIKQGDKTLSISLSKHGFTTQTRSVKTNKTRSVHFTLDPKMMMDLNP